MKPEIGLTGAHAPTSHRHMGETKDKHVQAPGSAAEREARLAKALRDNLRRRKQASRKPDDRPSDD